MNKKILSAIITCAVILSSVSGCGNSNTSTVSSANDGGTSSVTETSGTESENSSETEGSTSSDGTSAPSSSVTDTSDVINQTVADDMFTERDLAGTYSQYSEIKLSDSGITGNASNAAVNGSTVTINGEGVYLVSGSLSDGQIIIDAGDKDKVQLVLSGCSVNKNGGAAIQVVNADKVFITLADGTENTLSSKGEFSSNSDTNVDGAVFSKSDIVFNGTGTLKVECETAHGLVSKNDLKIANGIYNISSAKQGISGKDSVRIAGGIINVTSGKDAIHSENTGDSAKGFVYVSGGKLTLNSANDAIDASSSITVVNGNFDIKTADGSANVQHAGGDDFGFGGWNNNQNTSDDTPSTKALKADTLITINGGNFKIDSADDAIHSNADVKINGGNFEIATGDDAIHGGNNVTVADGKINITKSYEGVEGLSVDINGGEITLISSDDGFNCAGGNDGSGMGGGGMFENNPDAYLKITGGKIDVTASGDGLDANGSIYISGGEVYVSGPENGGNGSLDYAGTAEITGGICMIAGSSGMAQSFGNTSSQGVIFLNMSGNTGDTISVADDSGKVLASYTANARYQIVIVSAPEIELNKTYTVTAGANTETVTMTNLVMGSNGGGFGGPGGGRPGGRHDDFRPF